MAGVPELKTVGLVRLTGASAKDIVQIESSAIAPGVAGMLLAGAGQYRPTMTAVQQVIPVLSFTSSMLKTLIDLLGTSGIHIGSGQTYTGLEIYIQAMEKGGKRRTGANHYKIAVTDGMVLPRTLSANQGGGPATMAVDVIAFSDGANAPVTPSGSASLPVVAAASEMYVIGTVKANGSFIYGTQTQMLTFGLTEVTQVADGDVYPSWASVMGQQPVFDFTTNKLSWLTTVGFGGIAISASNCYAFLRKCTGDGTRVANNVAEHISILFDKGRIEPVAATYTQDGAIAQGFRFVPVYASGANDIIALSTVATIS